MKADFFPESDENDFDARYKRVGDEECALKKCCKKYKKKGRYCKKCPKR